MERKKLLTLVGSICLVLVLVVLPFSACAPAPEPTPAPAPEPYKIGFVTSITGFMGPMGSGAREGVLLVTDKINGAGGINGHPLELIIYDDESDPSKGVLAFKKLIEEDKVLGICGPVSTGIALACAPVAEEAQVPMFAQNSSSWSVAEKPWDIPNPPANIRHWVFKAGIDPIFQYMALYEMLRDVGATKLVSINVNNAMGKAMRAALEATYEKASFEVVLWEEYGSQDTDMTVPLTKIKAVDFDAMVISGAEMAGGITYKQAREMGITQPIVATPPVADWKIVDAMGESINGLMVPSYLVSVGEALPSGDPQRSVVLELTKMVVEETGRERADTGHSAGWDGIYLFADALRRADPDLTSLTKARSQLRDALETTKGFVGVQIIGDMTKWHEIPAPMIPCEVRDGMLIIIGEKIGPTWADLE